ncbi:uncharacterized protein LOC115589205 [Sparus aurata]|uniref:uncharacterized protein LOC115589205 n=1 Tax=Sparus aurata TaxID=8175 RepID=UPI0011C171E9|nr:uncharacterized protein LOC115589205 [Sparus aurata]
MSSSPPPVQYHGLLNQGETCYLNSVLQVLFMTKDFRAAVERHCCEYPATECIDRQLKDLFDDLKGNTAYTYNITKKLGIDRVYEQQDAAEYYEKILSLTSPDASQMFHGWLTDRTTCSACGTETDTDGAFWHLPLALVDSYSEHYSVVDGIKEHFKASEFSGENQMYCEKCDAKCDATIQCVMKHHPEVLMLLLKRFDFDYRYMTYVKINQTVDVPRILQIPENQTYELYAVVNHSGDLSSGCYSATIWDDENWFTFTDSRVTLADYQPFQEDNFEKSCSAYLLFYRKQNATQTTRAVSAPGGHQPATGDVYEQCKDAAKKRERQEGEAIDRDEETERVRSRGVELQPDPRYHENDQDTRDEVETGVKEGEGGYPETENQAEEMEPLCRVTQREESVDDRGSGKEGAPDVSDDLKPEISDMLVKDAHLRKEVERSVEETGVMDVKTGEDKQSEKEGKSLTNYPEDNAGENVDENLRGTQEVRQDYDLRPVSEDKQRDERGRTIDDKEGKTEAGERGIASEIGKINHDYGRDGGSKQNMPKHDHKHREERMDVQEVMEQKRGDGKHAQSKDTSVTKRYPTEGVQAQDSDSVRRDDASVHPEQKIRIMPTIQEDVELDKKGKTEVHDRGMVSRPTKLLTKYDLVHSHKIQDDRRVDDNKQKVPKDDQRCKEGGSSRHEGHEQERGVRRDVKGVMERNRGDSENPHFGQDVEDQSFVGLDDRQRMSEQKISGTYPSRKDDGAETLSKHIQNRSDSSLRRAGSAGSSKPAECQEAGCGEQVRRNNPQPKPTLEFPESTREERPCSKDVVIKITDTEIRSGTVARSSVFSNLGQAGSVGSSNQQSVRKLAVVNR